MTELKPSLRKSGISPRPNPPIKAPTTDARVMGIMGFTRPRSKDSLRHEDGDEVHVRELERGLHSAPSHADSSPCPTLRKLVSLTQINRQLSTTLCLPPKPTPLQIELPIGNCHRSAGHKAGNISRPDGSTKGTTRIFPQKIAARHPTYGKRRGAPTAPRRPYSLSLTTDWRNRSPTP